MIRGDNSLHPGYALYHQVIAGQSSRFVEAADVDLTGEWNPERLRAKYSCVEINAEV